MRRIPVFLGLTALVIAISLSQQGQPPAGPRPTLLSGTVASVRIELGVRDMQPRSWNGSVSARAGEVVNVRNWHPRPGDTLAGSTWQLQSRRGINFTLRAWEIEQLTAPVPYVNTAGVIIGVSGHAGTELAIETANGNFVVRPFELAPGTPLRVLDGNVIAERVSSSETVSSVESDNDVPTVLTLPRDGILVAWVSFRNNRNELLSRAFDGKQWSAARPITSRHTDIQAVKLARDRAGQPVAVWSAQVDNNWDLYASRLQNNGWTNPERLTTDPQPDVYPAMATDSNGNAWVVWQGFRNGKSDVFSRRFDGRNWTSEERISASPANDWAPAIAADSTGSVYIGWDTYDKGNYDVLLRKWEGRGWKDVTAIADSVKFEVQVSLACDKQNRLWAAWNESGTDWGKDTGFLPRKQGTPLYRSRWMSVAVHDGQKWMQPAPIEDSLPIALRGFNDLPIVHSDQEGRIWLAFRHRSLRMKDTPPDTPAHRAAWEIHVTTYEGDHWTTPYQAPFSQGRQDMRMSLAASPAGLYAAYPADNRDFEDYLSGRMDVYVAKLPTIAQAPGALELTERVQPPLKTFPTHYEEAKDLARIHGYTLSSGGRNYKIYRGDTHRHTEFSMDGNNDGSLLDAYRYAMDAAELDFMLVSEHNGLGGPDRPYINWILQQTVDVFSVAGKFTPFYGYERSVVYPNGHRNILFTNRGNPTLPIPPEEQQGKTGAKMLYEYLKKYKGIAISHTSATTMGTDWRDNDPEVEPLVEIYQGDRVSAEYEGAPKAAYGGNPASAPGGFRPAGYVWNAWAKGYKLGVQSASDHLSTHISYACTIATDFTRQGLIDAMKARHSYGATDNIVLDYRMKANGKEYLQGDIVDVPGTFELTVKVLGTQPVRQIDVIRGNRFLMTRSPMQREVDFSFRDTTPEKGESYYYVRVMQVDDQIAWSSPIWIKRK
ncbi:MAG TPA: DUF3604 domain-containing protein [Bryobacteraceae bacterium]|nr:DUF3604 domain-containing protein [Bryobacteraceae bacterium]